jgi:hypothetical protein
LYLRLPAGDASTLKYVGVVKSYVQFVIPLCTFVGKYDGLYE